MPNPKNDASLNLRLTGELKKTVEDAAAEKGQTVSDFAIVTLEQAARQLLQERQVTRLSERDGLLLAKILDDETTAPNDALVKAAWRYKRHIS